MTDDRLTPQDAGRILDRIEASPESLRRWRKTILAVLRADPHPKRARRIALIEAMCANDDAVRAAREDPPRLAALRKERRALDRRWRALTLAPAHDAATEELIATPSLDRFTALLPQVDLTCVHGSGADPKFSPYPLIWAIEARRNPVERVQRMLNAGASPRLANKLGQTVLHEMMARPRKSPNRLAIIRLLVLRGADIGARDCYGMTPLLVALARGCASDATHLIAAGAAVGVEALQMASREPAKAALVLAHLSGRADLPAIIAEMGPWLRLRMMETEQQLADRRASGHMTSHHARLLDQLRAFEAEIARLPGFVPASSAETGLRYADEPAAFIAVQNAKTLADFRQALARVDITSFPQDAPNHPIHWPLEAESDRPERLWAMLVAGARVETGPRFAPVLHELLHNRRRRDSDQTRLVEMLVQAGAKLEARDGDGCTALNAAIHVNALPEAKALLKAGADANATGRFHPKYQRGRPGPILFAAVDQPKLFALLLDHGADPQRKAEGVTLGAFIAAELARCAAELCDPRNGVTMIGRWERNAKALRQVQAILTRLG